jgi:hypothetical protein
MAASLWATREEMDMNTKSRIGLAVVLAMTGFGLIVLSGPSQAEVGEDLPKVVKKIAAELKKGNDAGAKKMAVAAARKIDEISELMHMYRPEDKDGLGLEAALKNATPKNAEELGNLTRAMAELTLAKGWDEPKGKKTKKAWNDFTMEMSAAAKDLAKAKDAAAVTKAATKVNDTCARCHSIFKN